MMMMMGGNSQIITTQNEGGGSLSGMNPNGGEGGGGGGGGIALKKGPWTAAEDAVLAEYVRTHGEGNWNAVQKNTGLARCGKSCRLRWANHLRPNLKKGAFSPEEERIIVELHAKMGNKWARMATQLPGRTDNEIKNYWNTRVKRRQRQGLPLYPPDIQPMHPHHHHSRPPTPITSSSTPPTPLPSGFSFQAPPTTMLMQQQPVASPHSLHIPRSASTPLFHNYPPPPPAASTAPLPSPNQLSQSPLHSPHKHNSFSTLPLFDNSSNTNDDLFFFSRPSPLLQSPLRYKRFKHGDCNEDNNDVNSFMFPFSPLLKSSNNLFEPTHPPPQYPNPVSLEPITNDLASSTRNHIPPRPHLDSGQFVSPTTGFVYPLRTELPSNQLLHQEEVARNNYGNSNMNHSHSHHNLSMPMNGGNGLLEDMLEEAHVLGGSTNDVLRGQNCLVGFSTSSSDHHDQGFASVMKPKQESTHEQVQLNAHDDQEDYSRLLNVMNPPSSMPIPEWYADSGGEGSNGQSSVITDDNLGLELHHLANSLLPVDHHHHHNIAPHDHGRATPSSRSWDNMPGSNCQ